MTEIIANAESAQDDLAAFAFETRVDATPAESRAYAMKYGWRAEWDVRLTRIWGEPLERRAETLAYAAEIADDIASADAYAESVR